MAKNEEEVKKTVHLVLVNLTQLMRNILLVKVI